MIEKRGKELLDEYLAPGNCLFCGQPREDLNHHYCDKCQDDEAKEIQEMKKERRETTK